MEGNYRGYLIVGFFPQIDVWAIEESGHPEPTATELVEEWDRESVVDEIKIWSRGGDAPYYQMWGLDEELDTKEYKTVQEAKEAVDKLLGEKGLEEWAPHDYTYIVEESHDREQNTFSWGVTVYFKGEMVDDYTEWFDTQDKAFDYAIKTVDKLNRGQ